MSDFNAKMHQNQFRVGLCPRPHWGSLQCSLRTPTWNKGGLILWEGKECRDGKGGEGGERTKGEGKGREGKAGKWTMCVFLNFPYGFSGPNW